MLKWFHKWYANINNYFWLPCPLCGKEFGGHQWKDWNYPSLMTDTSTGTGVCKDCGNIARLHNLIKYGTFK